MEIDDEIKKIIDEFFAGASEAEIIEFMSLLEERKKGKSFLGNLNLGGIATGFADSLKDRMGITNEKISLMAREIVRNMILQYDQNISDENLDALLNKWVPDRENTWKRLPSDARQAMVSQFVAYGRGELTEEHLKAFPDKWAEKYWAAFPENLQKLIRSYLTGDIKKSEFMISVKSFFN